MKLISLEIPDEAAKLAGWLESQLVGLNLTALVAELEAVHGFGQGLAEPPLSLETILGNQRDAVVAQGLGSLSQERLGQLLRHPRLLLDLQELIVSSGSLSGTGARNRPSNEPRPPSSGPPSTATGPGWRPT
jgi:hypothetical protein